MIKLKTECEKCLHEKICRNKGNARLAMEKLKNTQYGDGPNDDYDWDIIMESKHVNIEFSCPDYYVGVPKASGIDISEIAFSRVLTKKVLPKKLLQ